MYVLSLVHHLLNVFPVLAMLPDVHPIMVFMKIVVIKNIFILYVTIKPICVHLQPQVVHKLTVSA